MVGFVSGGGIWMVLEGSDRLWMVNIGWNSWEMVMVVDVACCGKDK